MSLGPRKRRPPATIKRARRRLISRLFRERQLHLFEDRSEAAAAALDELKRGLAEFDAELQELKQQP
jgi:hypothetical protein